LICQKWNRKLNTSLFLNDYFDLKNFFQELPGTADITADVDFKYISQQVLWFSFLSDTVVVVPRETREGWSLLTVETDDALLSRLARRESTGSLLSLV
jgi:hypothetical protein